VKSTERPDDSSQLNMSNCPESDGLLHTSPENDHNYREECGQFIEQIAGGRCNRSREETALRAGGVPDLAGWEDSRGRAPVGLEPAHDPSRIGCQLAGKQIQTGR
jgi:hypothetical protein